MRFPAIAFVLFLCIGLSAQNMQLSSFGPVEYKLQQLDSGKRKLSEPQKAALLSAIIPGTGQIYNKRYWKAGIVYAGAAGLIYMFKTNVDSMNRYQTAYNLRIDGDTNTIDHLYPLLTDAAVRGNRDFHRRLRDISILGFVGLYALQIIDANVDAHLKEFRVNEDLSFRIRPSVFNSPVYSQISPGLKLTMSF